ncbi:MAG: DUF3365 domain-containing protein [Alphaproteobacteria bacterium]|nr:DUF3365 domain-containing protein [Alphaproteobacteria bacterium]
MTNIRISAGAMAVLVCLATAPAIAQDGKPKIGELRKAANGQVVEMKRSLQKELQAAIKAGGFVKALEVCKTVAPSIATAQSESGMSVRRTALKTRNPDNAPDAYERKVLEQFVADAAAGKDLKKMQHAEIVEADGAKVFRFMRAIPTGKLCLNCHGDSVKENVKAEIDKLYPKDEATGFKQGELRGAFSISKKL